MASHFGKAKKPQLFESNLTHSTPAPQAPPPIQDSFPAADAKKAAVEDIDETFGDDDDVSMSDDPILTAVDSITESDASVNKSEVDMVDDTPIDINANLNTVNDVAGSNPSKVTEGYTFELPIRGANTPKAKVTADRDTPSNKASGTNDRGTPSSNKASGARDNGISTTTGLKKPGRAAKGGGNKNGITKKYLPYRPPTWLTNLIHFIKTDPSVANTGLKKVNGVYEVWYPIVGDNQVVPDFTNWAGPGDDSLYAETVFRFFRVAKDWKKH